MIDRIKKIKEVPYSILPILLIFNFLYFFSSSSSLSAFDEYDHPQTCQVSSTLVFAEYLLFKPCIDDLDFAIKSDQDISTTVNPQGTGKFQTLNPEFESGFRLGVDKNAILAGFGLSFRYLYLKAQKSASVTRKNGGSLVPTMIHLGNVIENSFNAHEAIAKWSMRFQTFDVLVNHPIEYQECLLFTPYFGAEGLMIHQMIKSEFSSLVESMRSRWESDFFGVGIVIGTRFDWQYCSYFTLYTDVAARIIRGVADMDDHFRIQTFDSLDQNFKFRYDDCHFIPGYSIAIGIEFSQEFCSQLFSFDMGYEFMNFSNMQSPRRYVNGNGGFPISTSPSTSSVGLHGIFAGIRISF